MRSSSKSRPKIQKTFEMSKNPQNAGSSTRREVDARSTRGRRGVDMGSAWRSSGRAAAVAEAAAAANR